MYSFVTILLNVTQEVIADIKASQAALRKQEAAIAQQASRASSNASSKSTANSNISLTKLEAVKAANLYNGSTFAMHARLFEKHRLKSIKRLLSTTLQAELRYHCRAIEELSAALHAISDLDTEI